MKKILSSLIMFSMVLSTVGLVPTSALAQAVDSDSHIQVSEISNHNLLETSDHESKVPAEHDATTHEEVVVVELVDACPNDATDPGVQNHGPCYSDDMCPDISGIQLTDDECRPHPVDQDNSTATIHATKIVCDNESDLPNWGENAPDINSTTASTWINGVEGNQYHPAHPNCHLESGWQFQTASRGPDYLSNIVDLGGSYRGEAGAPWTTIAGVTDVNGSITTQIDVSNVWHLFLREVLKEGYVPFSATNPEGLPGSDVSAEIYCSSEGQNYDNYETFVPVAGQDYYCIAFNALTDEVPTPTTGTLTVTKVVNNVNSTTPKVVADFPLFVDGTTSITSGVGSVLSLGAHVVSETNLPNYTATFSGACDPEGHVTVSAVAANCTITNTFSGSTGGGTETITVDVVKYIQEGQTTTLATAGNTNSSVFPLTSTWTAANLNGGVQSSGNFSLGPVTYTAQTSPMNVGADYSVVENMGKVCNAENVGQYVLVGYKLGSSIEAALASTVLDTASFTNLQDDMYVVVINKLCGQVAGETSSIHTTIVSGDTSAGENVLGWMFNRDLSTQSPFEFNTDAASIGTGSLFVQPITNTVIGNSDKFIGELFLQTPIADLNNISYDFKIGAPDSTVEEQFYMSVYATFGESSPTKFYDCRYNVVPVSGSTGAFTTVNFDPTQSYPVTTRTGGVGVASPYACPSSPSGMDALSTGSKIRAIALNVGDTSGSDTGVSGYLDKVVTSITTGLNTHTETYDFEPITSGTGNGGDTTPTNNTRRSTSGSRAGGRVAGASSVAPAAGEVLGAETEICSAVETYMRRGYKNDAVQVTILQNFLNSYMRANLAVNGVYNLETENAVRAFQQARFENVLKPWGLTLPTGIFYKTSLAEAKRLMCPDLFGNLPIPLNLIPWSANKANVPPKA